MRLDYQSAISDLRRAVELLQAGSTSEGDFSARLYDFTTALFGHPLCAAALDAALEERGGDSDVLQQNCAKLACEVVADLEKVFRWIIDLDQQLTANPPNASGRHDELVKARKQLDGQWQLTGTRIGSRIRAE